MKAQKDTHTRTQAALQSAHSWHHHGAKEQALATPCKVITRTLFGIRINHIELRPLRIRSLLLRYVSTRTDALPLLMPAKLFKGAVQDARKARYLQLGIATQGQRTYENRTPG